MALTDQAFNWYVNFKDNASAALERANQTYRSTVDALNRLVEATSNALNDQETIAGRIAGAVRTIYQEVRDGANVIRDVYTQWANLGEIEFDPGNLQMWEAAQALGAVSAAVQDDINAWAGMNEAFNEFSRQVGGLDPQEFWTGYWEASEEGMPGFWNHVRNAGVQGMRDMFRSIWLEMGDIPFNEQFWASFTRQAALPDEFVQALRHEFETNPQIAQGFWDGIMDGFHRVRTDIANMFELAMNHPRIFHRFTHNLRGALTQTGIGSLIGVFSLYKVLDLIIGPIVRELADLIGLLVYPLQEAALVIMDEMRPALLELQAPMILLANRLIPHLRKAAFWLLDFVEDAAKGFQNGLPPLLEWIVNLYKGINAVFDLGMFVWETAKLVGGFWVAMLVLSGVIMVVNFINSVAQAILWMARFAISIVQAAWAVGVFTYRIFTEFIPAMVASARNTYIWVLSLFRADGFLRARLIPTLFRSIVAQNAATVATGVQSRALTLNLIPALQGAWAMLTAFAMAVWRGAVTVVTQWIPAVFRGAMVLITELIPALWAAAVTFVTVWIPAIWSAVVSMVAGIIPAIGGAIMALIGLIPVLLSAAAAAWTFTIALLANPITWVVLAAVAAVGALIAIMWYFWDSSKSIMDNITEKFWVFLGPIGWSIKALDVLYDKFDYVRLGVDTLTESLKNLWNWIKSWFGGGEQVDIGPELNADKLVADVAKAGEAVEEETQGWGDWLKGLVGIPNIETDPAKFMEDMGLNKAGGDGANALEDYMKGMEVGPQPTSLQNMDIGAESMERDPSRITWKRDALGNVYSSVEMKPNGIPQPTLDTAEVTSPYDQAQLNVQVEEDYSKMSDPVVTAVDRQTKALLGVLEKRSGMDHDLSLRDLDDMANFGGMS